LKEKTLRSPVPDYDSDLITPTADVLQRLVGLFDVPQDYIVNGNKSDLVEQTLKDAELIKQFKKLDNLPEEEKNTILKVINALIRDFNARQAYVSKKPRSSEAFDLLF
jgi:hypothetical protein